MLEVRWARVCAVVSVCVNGALALALVKQRSWPEPRSNVAPSPLVEGAGPRIEFFPADDLVLSPTFSSACSFATPGGAEATTGLALEPAQAEVVLRAMTDLGADALAVYRSQVIVTSDARGLARVQAALAKLRAARPDARSEPSR